MSNKTKYKAVLFDIDDTLFNSSLMSTSARKNAVRALRRAGVEIEEDKGYSILSKIVKKYGSNYGEHFNRFLEELGYQPHPKLIANAVVAYHSEKQALLRPFPDVVLTLLILMKELKIGVVSDGIQEKQWEKLIYLGLQHFFESVVINEKKTNQKPGTYGFQKALNELGIEDPSEVIYVGNSLDRDIVGANRMGLVSVLYDPKNKVDIEKLAGEEKPDYTIKRISEITKIVGIKQNKKAL
ncbi:MAG: TIGR02253 family HAD-type hydrolase [Candidatus Heimdallarchaeota archaeon]